MKLTQSIPYPLYTEVQRDALSNVKNDFIIYNSTHGYHEIYRDGSWNRTKLLDNNEYTQYLSSGTGIEPGCIDNGDGSVTIGASTYYLYDNSTFGGLIKSYEVLGDTITLVDGNTNYIVVDYNNGSPILRNTIDIIEINESDVIPVYTITRQSVNLTCLFWKELGKGLSNKLHYKDVKLRRFELESGLSLDETGVRNITVTAGKVWTGVTRVSLTSIDTSISGDVYVYYHNAGNWEHSVGTQYNNIQYDDGTNLQTLGNNDYTVNWVFRSIDENKDKVGIILGNQSFTTITDASNSNLPNIPDIVYRNSIFIGRIIVKKNDSSGVVEQVSSTSLGYTQVLDHNNLIGLQGGVAGEYYHLTNAEKVVIDNTSGTNTGDQDLSALALKSNVLELDNTDPFTPDSDYEPATKKYVDESSSDLTITMNEIFVDWTNGSDSNTGTQVSPFLTVQKALDWIEDPAGGNDATHLENWIIYLASGTSYANIILPEGVSLKGSGMTTKLEGVLTMGKDCSVSYIQFTKSHPGTTGAINITGTEASIHMCRYTGNMNGGEHHIIHSNNNCFITDNMFLPNIEDASTEAIVLFQDGSTTGKFIRNNTAEHSTYPNQTVIVRVNEYGTVLVAQNATQLTRAFEVLFDTGANGIISLMDTDKIPNEGYTGEILSKTSDSSYDVEWAETIDSIAGTAALYSGIYILTDSNISTSSIVTFGVSTVGAYNGKLKYTLSAGQCEFISTNLSDNVKFSYQIIY